MSASSLENNDAMEGWISVKDRLPATDSIVSVRQDQWAPCRAWLNERGEWRFIEYAHPHHVTHWKRD